MECPIEYHKRYKGKFAVASKVPLKTKEDLSLAYTPGVGKVSSAIAKDKRLVYELTSKWNTVAVVSDGSAVLGLGDIGPYGALPVMEGKCILFKHFGNVDAVPICLDTKNTEKIIETIKIIAPAFGGINLEDISAPRCFEIEERLKNELDIPVFHDDQHGTATVIVCAVLNSLRVVNKKIGEVSIVISGAGAAGIASANLLEKSGVKKIIMVDSVGIIAKSRTDINKYKRSLAEKFNIEKTGSLADALKGANIFIGLSAPGIVSREMVKSMAKNPIILAMANPVPEITPEEAYFGGAAVVGTGRSDYKNQVNNSLVFPGLFRGVLDARAKEITDEMKLAAAKALAALVKNPRKDKILPGQFDKGVADAIANAVKKVAMKNC